MTPFVEKMLDLGKESYDRGLIDSLETLVEAFKVGERSGKVLWSTAEILDVLYALRLKASAPEAKP